MPAPSRGPSFFRVALIGCVILTGVFVLGLGGIGGVLFLVYKGSEDTAKIGEVYLRNAPELRAVIDEHANVERNWMGWNVSVVNDGGNAHFTYSIKHDDGTPTPAEVWLIRSAGQWRAVGARVRPPSGAAIDIGKPPKDSGPEWN